MVTSPATRFMRLWRTKPARAAGFRQVVAMLALVAVAFQSYLTQTHIHIAAPVSAAPSGIAVAPGSEFAAKSASARKDAPNDRLPLNDDPMKCPLCQAVGYAGHFVTPSAAALLIPNEAISVLPPAAAIVLLSETPSHIWQGRGPPRS